MAVALPDRGREVCSKNVQGLLPLVYELSRADQALLLFLAATTMLMKCEDATALQAVLDGLLAVPGAPWRRATNARNRFGLLEFSPPCVLAGIIPFHVSFWMSFISDRRVMGFNFCSRYSLTGPMETWIPGCYVDLYPDAEHPLRGGQGGHKWVMCIEHLFSNTYEGMPLDRRAISTMMTPLFECMAAMKRWFPELFAVVDAHLYRQEYLQVFKDSGLTVIFRP